MQTTKRQHATGVIGLLLAEPQRFEYTQLINLLLRELRRQGIPYERAFRDVLAFKNSLSLSFPASEIQALEVEPQTQDAAEAARTGQPKRIVITPAFIGLLGACGTLPLHDTERIAARKALDGDTSQHALLDVLSNRLIELFYEAWGKYRVEHGINVRGHDFLLPMLTALAGTKTRSVRGLAGQETTAYFAGLLRTRPVSAGSVERVLTAYFGVRVRLEQFVGCWNAIPGNCRSTLGITMPVLGASAALGVRQWRHDLSIRLHVGPLEKAQLQGFLRGGSALAALEEMVSLFAVPMLRYEVRLLLAAPCLKRFTLNTRAAPHRLDWDTFLTGTAGVASRPDIRSVLRLSGQRASPFAGAAPV